MFKGDHVVKVYMVKENRSPVLIAKMIQRERALEDRLLVLAKECGGCFEVVRINRDPELLRRGIIVMKAVKKPKGGQLLFLGNKGDDDPEVLKYKAKPKVKAFIDIFAKNNQSIADFFSRQSQINLRRGSKPEPLGLDLTHWNNFFIKVYPNGTAVPALYDW